MTQVQIETAKKPIIEHDPLEDALFTLLSFYGVQADVKGILQTIPREQTNLSFDDFDLVARQIEFQSDIKKTNFNKLYKFDVPVLIRLSDETTRILFPQKTHEGKIYHPSQGVSQETLDDLKELYDGTALIFQPSGLKGSKQTKHMQKGHVVDWFWRPIVNYVPNYAEVILCSLFINLFVLALPLYTMNVYDRVVANFVESTLFVLSIGIGIALLFDFLFKVMRTYILEKIAADVGKKYDFDLMDRLLKLRSGDMELSVGEKANLFREIQGIRDFYAAKLAPTIVDIPFFLLFMSVIYMISPSVVLVPVIGAGIIILANWAAEIPINRATESYFLAMQHKSTVMIETLAGMGTIKMFNAIGNRMFQWDQGLSRAADESARNQFILGTVTHFSMMVTHLIHVFVLFVGVYQIEAGNLTIGGLIACSIISGRAMGPIMGLSGIVAKLKQTKDILNTIDNIFRLPHDDEKLATQGLKGPFKGRIELQRITFQYPGQPKPAANDISLVIEPGQRLGLIGRTGAGKSTMAQIMAGFITPQKGSVMIDSFTLDSIAPTELRREIGFVPQDAFFFSGSMRDNIVLDQGFVDEKTLKQAIEISGLDLVMEQTGQGLDMEVGENGGRLSGGQKQAIALARVLVRDPRIVILDEPTTGMDTVLEGRVRNALNEYLKNRTFIMVTHRTTLLPLVERLAVMDNGRMVALGPRDEILKKLGGGQ